MYMRFVVLTAVKILMKVFWVVIPCGLVGRYQHFGETYWLHRHPDHEPTAAAVVVVVLLLLIIIIIRSLSVAVYGCVCAVLPTLPRQRCFSCVLPGVH
jgi:hypothetical protein